MEDLTNQSSIKFLTNDDVLHSLQLSSSKRGYENIFTNPHVEDSFDHAQK